MRLLAVSPRISNPPRRGSAARTSNLLRQLSRRHEVREFSMERLSAAGLLRRSDEVRIGPRYREHRWRPVLAGALCELCERDWVSAPVLAGAALRLGRPALLRRWLAWAEVVLVEFPWQFAACRRLAPRAPLVLASHNVEARKFASYADAAGAGITRRPWLAFIERVERGAVRGAELVLAVSELERRELAERYAIAPERILLVPNGADPQVFRPTEPAARPAARRRLGLPERPTVVFAGSDVPPNRAALEWIRRLAARTDRFTFLVIGAVSRPHTGGRGGSLRATGTVEDLPAWLAAADISLCPLRHGAGTKIKLLETMAAGLPNVAFPEAVVGLDVRDGEHLAVVKPSESALLAALDAWADDPERAHGVGRAAADLVARRYDWARIADGLAAELETRFGGGAPGGRGVSRPGLP